MDGLEINMSFSQMLKGKNRRYRNKKRKKTISPCKTEEADSIKKKPASIPLQTDEIVQNPA
ncbi:MAG: hypothetical protein ACLR0U_16435 [Enterocloster clostridioformis]